MRTKKGLSPIITTILLILIALIAVLFIYSVVVPFVKDLLGSSKLCYKTQGHLEINTESGYTCYYENGAGLKSVNLTIKRGMSDAGVEGFIITVSGDGKSKVYKIREADLVADGVTMYDGSNQIDVPEIGEERTYSIEVNFTEVTYAMVTPLVEGGQACEEGKDETTIEECIAF